MQGSITKSVIAAVMVGTSITASGQGWDIDYSNMMNPGGAHTRLQLTDDISEMDISLHETLFPVFHTLSVKSPEVYGLHGTADMYLQQTLNNNLDLYTLLAPRDDETARTLQFQARAIYTGRFDGGNVDVWLGASWQDHALSPFNTLSRTRETLGYNLGVDLNLAGFNVAGSYYDGEMMDFRHFNPDATNSSADCYYVSCLVTDKQGYIVKGGYTFGATQLDISYGESNQISHSISLGAVGESSELWTIGLYHDVNSWFKLMAEYSDHNTSSNIADDNTRQFSVGGFIRW
jgi:hypothetical protein